MKENVTALFIFNHRLYIDRGTPLRVRNLLQSIAHSGVINGFTLTLDTEGIRGWGHKKLGASRLSNIWLMLRTIRELNPSVVVFHSIFSARYFFILKILFPRQKFVLEMHGFIEEEIALVKGHKSIAYYYYKTLYGLVYHGVDGITTCSDTATKKLTVENKNVTTIYGGVDLSVFNSRKLTERIGPSSVQCDKFITIGYVGNSRVWQGLDFLIASFDELVTVDDTFRLHLILSDTLTLPPNDKIVVENKLPYNEVPEHIQDFDILVIPRPKNPVNDLSFPSKLMEYLAVGKAVVCSRTSDMDKIVTHEYNGLLYEPGSIKNFVETILMLKDEELRNELSDNAVKTAEQYTWDKQGKIFLKALSFVSRT